MKNIIRITYALILTALILLSVYLPNIKFANHKKIETLNIFVWRDLMSPEVVAQFEEKYDVKVKLYFYTSDEELIMKITHTGCDGYDIIFSSNCMIKPLSENNYIKPIDKNRLNFFDTIDAMLINKEFDYENKYSIPYTWEVLGIAINKAKLPANFEPSISKLFTMQATNYDKIVMTPDPLEATILAAHHLFGTTDKLSKEQIDQIRQLLNRQRQWTEAYTEYRAKYIVATENCPIALLKSSFLHHLDMENPSIDFCIPKEGVFTSIENIVIGATCDNDDTAYKFINFLYNKDIMDKQLAYNHMFPPTKDKSQYMHSLGKRYEKILEEIQNRKDIVYISLFIPRDKVYSLWIDSKT